MENRRQNGLLAWQWSNYGEGHRNRRNLTVHALTVPWFVLGSCALVLAPILGGWWIAGSGLAAIVVAAGLQGRTHKFEQTPPAPFRGPMDVLARLFVEQWVTFPRYVLSGGFGRAWRAQ